MFWCLLFDQGIRARFFFIALLLCACAILLGRFTVVITVTVLVRFVLITHLLQLWFCFVFSLLLQSWFVFCHGSVCNRPWKETKMTDPLSVSLLMIHEISEPKQWWSFVLQNSDQQGMTLVTFVLTQNNYLPRSRSVKISPGAKVKLGFINGKCVCLSE